MSSEPWSFELIEECLPEALSLIETQHLQRNQEDPLCMNLIFKAGWYPGSTGPKPWLSERQKGIKKGPRGPYRTRTAAHSLAISIAKTGKPVGPKSAEACAKLSVALKGKKKSLEHRAKLSAAKIGKTPWNKGKSLTPEHIRKRQESRYRSLELIEPTPLPNPILW
jgi:hypothetical protein